MITDRKKSIIKKLVEYYINEAQPISSGMLAKKDFPKLSSATLRNEMLDLTNQGFLFQPHASAGKVPTENAFRFFLENFIEYKELDKKSQNNFLQIQKKNTDQRKKIKEIAKEMASQSGEAVIVVFSKDDYFYTGLSQLFSQPEFQDLSLIHDLSRVIDHLDKTLNQVFDKIEKTKILLGQENPFGNHCAVILTAIKKSKEKIIIGLLGPTRMNYNKNISLIEYINKIFD